ncbi:MAG: HAMP domain-containing sensor histidine kinase [Bacteroidota bacterium]
MNKQTTNILDFKYDSGNNKANLFSFLNIVKNKNYNIKNEKIEDFVSILASLLSDSITYVETEKYLDLYIKEFPDFYNSNLVTYILSVYEKYVGDANDKSKAISLATNIVYNAPKKVSYALSSLLRICKTINKYYYIDDLFSRNPDLKKINTFDVLYELIFYYQYKNDSDKIEHIIRTLIHGFSGNKQILQTARTLSIRYGVYEKFEDLFKDAFAKFEKKPPKSLKKGNYDEVFDTENELVVNSYERALSSAALADLTQGIAHEFGQPVTNIRYNIQFHTIIFEEESGDKVSKSLVLNCFKDILIQTERIGNLVDSLSPITSSKSMPSVFNLYKDLEECFQQERVRLKSLGISYKIEVSGFETIEFDKIQFNQIITNLIINSIDSLEEKKESLGSGFTPNISIFARKISNGYSIEFSDNGKGIKVDDKVRIFNPFYTTKPPGKGQGLGLYIISNLLKMHSGSIKLDNNYSSGAKFKIFIPK